MKFKIRAERDEKGSYFWYVKELQDSDFPFFGYATWVRAMAYVDYHLRGLGESEADELVSYGKYFQKNI